MPGECCTVKGIGGDDDKNDASLSTVVEDSETNKDPKVLSPAVTSQVAGVPGAKNVAPTAGLTDAVEGDRNEFVKTPPSLLNVSTYLEKRPN